MRRRYSQADREQAVAAWLSQGECLARAAKALGFPPQTVHEWYKSNPTWWAETAEKIRSQHEAEYRAKIREILVAGFDETLDRVANGDERIDTKTGAKIRVKMSGRDLSTVCGIMYDKMRLSLGQPTSIAGKGDKSAGDKLEQLREAARDLALREGKESGKVTEIKQAASHE